MTAPDLSALCADLKAKAEAATPGEWTWTPDSDVPESTTSFSGLTSSVLRKDQIAVLYASGMHTDGWIYDDNEGKDAAFIAAANPAVVLRLVAALEAQATAMQSAIDAAAIITSVTRDSDETEELVWRVCDRICSHLRAVLAAASPETATEGANGG